MMTEDQAKIAVPLANSYAHQYLGLSPGDVLISGGRKGGSWMLLVATAAGVEVAEDFDAAKRIIDEVTA